ncbi:MAG: excinuclease ABC [Rikenellaceae bacterium]|nr:excinuclease ABC [Rikenellaceae bacterium]MBR3911335.1 excinuclease ABC [Alistipes sp.]
MENNNVGLESLRFDEKTQAYLGSYVYMLIDPDDKKPFYVGKGRGNRVFDHIHTALNSEDVTEKYDVIRDIVKRGKRVEHIIVCHGMTSENEAYKIESCVIDVLNYCGNCLTNEVSGHHSAESGIMTVDEIKRLYTAEPLEQIAEDCMIININGQYSRNMGSDAIYTATKETWKIAKNRTEGNKKINYVLSEYRGLIVEVFKVDKWYSKEREYGPNSKKAGQKYWGYGFNGQKAEDKIRNRYINKSIAHKKVRGRSNPITYNL